MTVLLTGCAGFIGYHVGEALLAHGKTVLGVDSLSDYYDVNLKRARLNLLESRPGFRFMRLDLSLKESYGALPSSGVTHIIHLAAQAGVRHSLLAPEDYIRDNVLASTLMHEYARRLPNLAHYLYASSSSVYGANVAQPFRETDVVRRPNSLYAATKGACELIGRCYASLYGAPSTGLRFFTVYGPWGRPDMAPWIFAKAIMEDNPIRVFNRGMMKRDFTYVDDVTRCVVAALDRPPLPTDADMQDPAGFVPHRVVNIGNGSPVALIDFIRAIESAIGKKAIMRMEDMQPGDVCETYADVTLAHALYGYSPTTTLEKGVPAFVSWYKNVFCQ
ncbi:MAG: NAD-dependent epimerase/dehydratase family protein [Rickettsiales bacterium]